MNGAGSLFPNRPQKTALAAVAPQPITSPRREGTMIVLQFMPLMRPGLSPARTRFVYSIVDIDNVFRSPFAVGYYRGYRELVRKDERKK